MYLVSARYDLGFFILSPVLALLLTIVMARFPVLVAPETLLGRGRPWIDLLLGVWINAHLFAVVFRSHLNQTVFERFRVRFTWVPVVLFAAFVSSDWLMVTGVVLGVLWDTYHSAMQNFGFCRLYDAKAGNPAQRGRRLDMVFNLVMYIGPICIGPNLAPNISVINSYRELGWGGPSQLFGWVMHVQAQLAQVVMIGAALFVAYYVLAYLWLVRAGHKVPRAKLLLLLSTGLINLLAWGYLPPLQAFFIMNFYHALQYFALVWATEQQGIQRLLPRAKRPGHALATLLMFASIVLTVGALHVYFDVPRLRIGYAFFTVVSLMHFWYDGFIWSVRKAHVTV
jgi:hypothetical protein